MGIQGGGLSVHLGDSHGAQQIFGRGPPGGWVYDAAPYPMVRNCSTRASSPLVMSDAPPKASKGSAYRLGAPQSC